MATHTHVLIHITTLLRMLHVALNYISQFQSHRDTKTGRIRPNRIFQTSPHRECRRKEMAHVQYALKTIGYKQWMFKVPRPNQQQRTTYTGTRPKTNVGLPYMPGISEALTRVFKAHGMDTYHRPINTIVSILVHPKDKTPDAQKCGLVYQVECPECPLTYIGETGRTLATRMKDHLNLRNTQLWGTRCALTPQNNQ